MSLQGTGTSSIAAVFLCMANFSGTALAATTNSSAGFLSMSTPTVTTVQHNGIQNIEVKRADGIAGAATVLCKTVNNSAVAGKNYTAVSTTLQWASGDWGTRRCTIPVTDAVPFSGSLSFFVELSDATGATLTSANKTLVTINGNKSAASNTLSIAASSYAVAQNAGSVAVTVNRTGSSSGQAVVYYATANKTAVAGLDYSSTQGSLTWANGDMTAKSFNVPVSNLKPFTGTKTLAVAIASPANAVLGSSTSAIVTINGDGSTVAVTSPASTSSGGGVSRPSYNTGSGFFVLNGKLYDPNGKEFRIRGVDRCHYDSNSAAGIAKSGANAVRMGLYLTSVGASTYVNVLQTQHIANKQVVIPGLFFFPDNTTVSGNQSTTELAAGVAWWVANASTFTALNKYMIINIANEWGPSNSTVWRDAYINAIAQLRAAGYLGTLMIDTGGYGQDMSDLLNYSTAVFNSDPQKNVIFSLHVYGGLTPWTPASLSTALAQLASLSDSVGMAFVIGEFGPGRNIGPSPTLLTPAEVITPAEANNIGWMGWAWDNNNLSGGASNDNGFSMTLAGPGLYTQESDLTLYGQDVVLNPTYGLSVLAKPATIF